MAALNKNITYINTKIASQDKLVDIETLALNLKERLEKVEEDLLIDLDGDGIPDIRQITDIRQN